MGVANSLAKTLAKVNLGVGFICLFLCCCTAALSFQIHMETHRAVARHTELSFTLRTELALLLVAQREEMQSESRSFEQLQAELTHVMQSMLTMQRELDRLDAQAQIISTKLESCPHEVQLVSKLTTVLGTHRDALTYILNQSHSSLNASFAPFLSCHASQRESNQLLLQLKDEVAMSQRELAARSQSESLSKRLSKPQSSMQPGIVASGNVEVEVVFHFPKNSANSKLASTASLYWLAANFTEHWYTEIPQGKHTTRKTRPGACWRVRAASTGNHLLNRYCATNELHQDVTIAAQEEVVIDLYFSKLTASSLPRSTHLTYVHIYSISKHANTLSELDDKMLLGELQQKINVTTNLLIGGLMVDATRIGGLGRGGEMHIPTICGTRFAVVEQHTNRIVKYFTASAEALQHINIGAGAVELEFISPQTYIHSVGLFTIWGDEHLQAVLKPGESRRIKSIEGERWIAREFAKDAAHYDQEVLTFDATSEQYQIIHLPHS